MKTRNELAVIAASASNDVVSIQCVPPSTGNNNGNSGTLYTYKAPRDLARHLKIDDYVLVEGDHDHQRPRNGPVALRVMRVQGIDDVCVLDNPSIVYKWAFAKADTDPLWALRDWEQKVVDQLHAAQRQRARQAMLQEIGADAMDMPSLPAEVRDEAVSEAQVIEDES